MSLLKPINDRYGTYRGLIRLGLTHVQLASGVKGARFEGDHLAVRRLVFVCAGNICRSPFADRYARALGIPSASFGLSASTGDLADAVGIATARTFGIDLEPHRATDIDDFKFANGDLLLFMETRHLAAFQRVMPTLPHKTALLGVFAQPSRPHIHDPHRLGPAYFATCYRVIANAVDALVPRLAHLRSTP
ncbi:MAG TPA: hypothetical protein VFS42_01255 [Burkholderiaceae bacterium]|nr:hypothetical protein [Burkholderiaceae bacterium]